MTEKVRLQVNNGQDIHFQGSLLHELTTQNSDGTKDRWTELRLWRTDGGAWVAEGLGRSDRRGEINIRDVGVIDAVTVTSDENRARLDVMDTFGWTIAAKAFAKAAGWDVIRRLD